MDTIDTYTPNTKYINILYLYANQITAILATSNADTMIIVKRFFHIINLVLRTYKIDTKDKEIKLTSIFTSISYAPPWDEEYVILDHIHSLCDFLSNYYPYNKDIENAVTEDIKHIKLVDEIKQILDLEDIKKMLELQSK